MKRGGFLFRPMPVVFFLGLADFGAGQGRTLTYGAKPEDLALLQYQTKAVTAPDIPSWLATETSELLKDKPDMTQPDFILILGNNYSE